MKNKLGSVIIGVGILVALFAIWIWNGSQPTSTKIPSSAEKVALSVAGKLGDLSYNDLTNAGFQKAVKEFGLDGRVVEPTTPAETKDIIRRLAESGTGLVIGVGFAARQPIQEIAPQWPATKFLLVDSAIKKPLPNVRSVQFKEHEAGFLAGIVAGLVTKSNKVGVVAGLDIPVVRRFVNGYRQGVKYVNKSAKVIVVVVGGFSDPLKGKELSMALYTRGVDIILNGAGNSGSGIFDAARQTGRFVIGVDLDQRKKAPGYVLTSALKKVDSAIYAEIKNYVEGSFVSGTVAMGVAEGLIDLSEINPKLVPEDIRQKIKDLVAKVRTKKIKVIESYSPL